MTIIMYCGEFILLYVIKDGGHPQKKKKGKMEAKINLSPHLYLYLILKE